MPRCWPPSSDLRPALPAPSLAGLQLDLTNPTQAKGALLSSLRSGDSSSFGFGAAEMLRKGEQGSVAAWLRL